MPNPRVRNLEKFISLQGLAVKDHASLYQVCSGALHFDRFGSVALRCDRLRPDVSARRMQAAHSGRSGKIREIIRTHLEFLRCAGCAECGQCPHAMARATSANDRQACRSSPATQDSFYRKPSLPLRVKSDASRAARLHTRARKKERDQAMAVFAELSPTPSADPRGSAWNFARTWESHPNGVLERVERTA